MPEVLPPYTQFDGSVRFLLPTCWNGVSRRVPDADRHAVIGQAELV